MLILNELFWKAFGWFMLVWWVSAGLFVIVMQFFLPRAWEQIRAHPPHGPPWAHALWYRRGRVYGVLMAVSLLLGALAAAIYLLSGI